MIIKKNILLRQEFFTNHISQIYNSIIFIANFCTDINSVTVILILISTNNFSIVCYCSKLSIIPNSGKTGMNILKRLLSPLFMFPFRTCDDHGRSVNIATSSGIK